MPRMATAHGTRRGRGLLLAGLGMMAAAVVLAILASAFAARGNPFSSASSVESLPEARETFERAVEGYGNADLEVGEVMEFSSNYYAEVRESGTGIYAMELLIDKRTGQVYPEPGPNMMWNTKYGMMSGGMGPMMGAGGNGTVNGPPQRIPGTPSDEMPVTPEQARKIAEDYLDRVSPGTEAEKPDTFYGYYTLHTERDGEVTGMLSVNGYSGEVWYHTWHGAFVGMEGEEATH
ncbi:hypothetical protein GBA63_18660 [Rubrobacter tropicus]|uniref:PepSY domain-containing protein n=2 Tax=Rubrobacter tropicus TaxID=2653851 RepID=A0A6G8QD81_9ACTN|nr:hypothetical protein [Rubrobacter tropicus]QIN84439.1 hypothetical protein GBA63_18660 [Rubrobacter tropicus]